MDNSQIKDSQAQCVVQCHKRLNSVTGFEDKMLRRIFGLKKEKIKGRWRFTNSEQTYLYFSNNNIRATQEK